MEQDVFQSIVQWFLYKEYPSHITKRDEKKNWKKKMKKYNYKEEDNNLFYHVNNKVLVIFYFFSTSHLYNRVRNIDLLSVICFSLFICI